MQGSGAAQALRDSLKSTHSMLVSSHQHSASVEEIYTQIASAIEASLHGNPNGQQPQASGKKPNKGVSKSKRAALVLDAMQPLLKTALEQVQSTGLVAGSESLPDKPLMNDGDELSHVGLIRL